MLINVLDSLDVNGNPDVTAAIASANDGDRIYFPGTRTYDAPAAGWHIQKSLEIFGDGPGQSASALRPHPNATDAVFVLDPQLNPLDPTADVELPHVYIHDLLITSPVPNSRVGLQGIRFAGASNKKLSELRLERVSISWLGDTGVQLHGSNAKSGAVVGVGILDCNIFNCGQQAISLYYAWAVQCVRTTFRNNQYQGLRIRGHELALYGCLFEDNCLAGGDAQLSAYDDAVFPAPPSEMQILRIDACAFRRILSSQPLTGIRLRQFQGGVCIGGCSFEQPLGSSNGTGIDFAALPTDSRGAPVILPNRFTNMATAIAVSFAPVMRALAIFPQFCDPSVATIQLPSSLNDAPVGIPAVNSLSGNGIAGLLVPAYEVDPSTNLQLGMLAYNMSTDVSAGKHLRVIRSNPDPLGPLLWKNIQTL